MKFCVLGFALIRKCLEAAGSALQGKQVGK